MTFASTVSRARRTPSSSVSSRSTCTCRPLTTRELVMTVWRVPELVCSCSTACALPAWRARRMGHAVVAQGAAAADPGPAGLEHVAAELADGILRLRRLTTARPAD